MKESWLCRNYEEGDEYQILALFKEVFGEEQSLDFWKWKFRQSPFGEGIIKLTFDGTKLTGQYAVIPMDMQVGDILIRAIWSIDTMIHSDYRGRGILSYLAREIYEECKLKGFKFVYGFPNEMIYPIRIRKLGWKGLGKMNILRKRSEGEVAMGHRASNIYQICRIERFGEDIDLLWYKVKGRYNVIVPRTKDYLNWRFVDHPKVNYIKYIIKDDDGEILGYVVLKMYATEKETKGHIIDVLSIDDKDAVRGLLKYACDYFAKNDIREVSCWMQDSYVYADVLKEQGFVREEIPGPYPYFGIRVFDEGDMITESVGSFPSWYLTMGDCDIF